MILKTLQKQGNMTHKYMEDGTKRWVNQNSLIVSALSTD